MGDNAQRHGPKVNRVQHLREEIVTQQRPPLAPKVPNFKNKGKAPIQAASTELDMCYLLWIKRSLVTHMLSFPWGYCQVSFPSWV